MKLKTLSKIMFIGLMTTAARILGQMAIPPASQSTLPPSFLAENGIMPLAFTIYGFFAYSAICSMFLLIRKRLYGNRIIQGLQYGFCCCAIWVVYLLEPLPHVAPVDQLTYPLADSFALVVMGILTGLLLGKTQAETSRRKNKNTVLPVLAIAACFVSWRTIQYLVIDIYSSFDIEPVQTIAWCFLTGLVIALIMAWINMYIDAECRIKQSLILGGLLFGLNLLLFNFFMPLVFAVDVIDLIIRTCVDIAAVTIGCLTFNSYRHLVKAKEALVK